MPRPKKRYFPVSQIINTDPEIRKLKRELGLSGFSMWLEILARTDPNKGLWRGSERDIRGVLAGVCESNTRGSARCLDWVTDIGWIRWQKGSKPGNREGLTVAKYWEYHTREVQGVGADEDTIKVPSYPNLPNPSEPIKKYIKKRPFPPDFQIAPHFINLAQEKGWANPMDELEGFRDYHLKKGSQFVDWDAAFRTWLRNGKKFAQENEPVDPYEVFRNE